MAVLTGENLIDEVRSIVGRPGSTDAGVITDVRVNRWLNEAQQKIVEACPGLPSREIDDATSWYCVSDEYEYDFTNLSSYCAGLQPCHVLELWYRNGNESYQMDYMPLDEFNDEYPDPPMLITRPANL
jgi:hypothetical protein